MAPVTLLPQHQEMLRASAIAPAVADARGYRSATTKADLRDLGFSASQQRVPGLLVPVHNVWGELAFHQLRPDLPRFREGKPVKYETPLGARMVVDVPPGVREQVRDPSVPLIITEGSKKADAAISAGLCCAALIGVFNFRGTNEHGGITSLPDWEGIALRGRDDHGNATARPVYLAFDSDVMLKGAVYAALSRLARFLEQRGASVAYVYLAHGEQGRKVGLDDFLAAGHTTEELFALATRELRAAPSDDRPGGPYRETEQGLVWRQPTKDGPVERPLTNFTARIDREIVEDDGIETTRLFEIRARRKGREDSFCVTPAAFTAMNWPVERMGPSAIVYPGQGIRDHARVAIQTLSGEPPAARVYKHTGWREIEPGSWVYLHAGGAIGAARANAMQVRLDGPLAQYALPTVVGGHPATMDVRACLALWDLAPPTVSIPLFGATWRAAICSANCSVWLVGPSSALKTQLAALAQQHFGPGMHANALPGSWSSTENALERLACAAKDALLVIDDYVPRGSAADLQRLHAKADRVMRAQGNNAGRQRMRPDGSLQPAHTPRGLLVATGEDIPPGQSLLARMVVLELAHGDVDLAALTQAQCEAAAGTYARAMAGFLGWLAPQYAAFLPRFHQEVADLRGRALHQGQHLRTPEIVANLAAGIRAFLRYAEHVGAVSGDSAAALYERAWNALGQVSEAQARHQASGDPAMRFLELLRDALGSGRAHVASARGDAPPDPRAWGWRRETTSLGEVWRPQGERVGWCSGPDLYLVPDAAYLVARRLGSEGGDGLSVTPGTLKKRLRERGLLQSMEQSSRGTLTVRRVLEEASRTVLHLRAETVMPTDREPADDARDGQQAAPGPDAYLAVSAETLDFAVPVGASAGSRNGSGAATALIEEDLA